MKTCACSSGPRRTGACARMRIAYALALLLPAGVNGQRLTGTVIDAGTKAPVPGASLTLLMMPSSVMASTEADDAGRYSVTAPRPGEYHLRVERIGYRSLLLGPLRLGVGTSEAVVPLEPEAVPLETLAASAGRVAWLERAGFYERKTLGHGRFIERADIEQRQPRRVSDLLRGLPGVRITFAEGNADVRLRAGGLTGFNARADMLCLPPVFLDGILVPPHYGGAHSACGVLLFWTRK